MSSEAEETSYKIVTFSATERFLDKSTQLALFWQHDNKQEQDVSHYNSNGDKFTGKQQEESKALNAGASRRFQIFDSGWLGQTHHDILSRVVGRVRVGPSCPDWPCLPNTCPKVGAHPYFKQGLPPLNPANLG